MGHGFCIPASRGLVTGSEGKGETVRVGRGDLDRSSRSRLAGVPGQDAEPGPGWHELCTYWWRYQYVRLRRTLRPPSLLSACFSSACLSRYLPPPLFSRNQPCDTEPDPGAAPPVGVDRLYQPFVWSAWRVTE